MSSCLTALVLEILLRDSKKFLKLETSRVEHSTYTFREGVNRIVLLSVEMYSNYFRKTGDDSIIP